MLEVILLIGLLLLTMCLVAVYAAFAAQTPRELKRRARSGDLVAAGLYRTVAYGVSSKLLLGGLIALSTYGVLALTISLVGAWSAIPMLLAMAILLALVTQPTGRTGSLATRLAARISPAVAWLLERLHPIFDRLGRLYRAVTPVHFHSGLYEKDDLVELLARQKTQPDNRISAGEIDMLAHALSFGDKTVAQALVPKRVVRAVKADEPVGPVLMGELHASGHSRFPVWDDNPDSIVGVLFLHDLTSRKQHGSVRDEMRSKVTYVHEDYSLYQTLQAFIKTKQHLFIVVNSFEEYVGIITIEDVLEQVIGRLIVDEFDRYDDLRAVAASAARKDHQAKPHATMAETPPVAAQAKTVTKDK